MKPCQSSHPGHGSREGKGNSNSSDVATTASTVGYRGCILRHRQPKTTANYACDEVYSLSPHNCWGAPRDRVLQQVHDITGHSQPHSQSQQPGQHSKQLHTHHASTEPHGDAATCGPTSNLPVPCDDDNMRSA